MSHFFEHNLEEIPKAIKEIFIKKDGEFKM